MKSIYKTVFGLPPSVILLVTLTLLAVTLSLSKSQAQQTNGDAIFSSNQIHTIYLQFSQTSWFDSLLATHAGDYYMSVNGIFDGDTLNNIGIKTKGNSSFNNPNNKKSLKIDFDIYDSTLAWDGLTKINLNNGFKDPTFLREKIALDFANTHGVYAPRCTYANVYLNNQLWGLYMLVEEVDNKFLKDRFGNKNGNLFKGDPNGTLNYMGASATPYYSAYELHTNEIANDWSDLILLCNTLNNSPAATLQSSLDTVIDLQEWYRAWACNILFANMDSYQGSGHNYFIYHNTITDKFEWISWDVNESFGVFLNGLTTAQLKALPPDYIPSGQNRPLETRPLDDADMKCDYYQAVYNLLMTGFDSSFFNPMIDSLSDWIRPSVYADPHKFFTNQDFEINLTTDIGNTPGLKNFIPERVNAVLPLLLASGCNLSGVNNELTNDNGQLTVYPNPCSEWLVVSGSWLGNTIEVKDVLGRTVLSSIIRYPSPILLDVNDLQAGIYFLSVKTANGKMMSRKIVIQ